MFRECADIDRALLARRPSNPATLVGNLAENWFDSRPPRYYVPARSP
jgi:hypothetical protein